MFRYREFQLTTRLSVYTIFSNAAENAIFLKLTLLYRISENKESYYFMLWQDKDQQYQYIAERVDESVMIVQTSTLP